MFGYQGLSWGGPVIIRQSEFPTNVVAAVHSQSDVYLTWDAALLADGDIAAGTVHRPWRGAVEPASFGAGGNEVRLSRGASEPGGYLSSDSIAEYVIYRDDVEVGRLAL